MKRIVSACLDQTIHFQLKEDIGHDEAVNGVKAEYAAYKNQLIRSRTKHQIVEEAEQADSSIIIKIKKQYNSYDTNGYLD